MLEDHGSLLLFKSVRKRSSLSLPWWYPWGMVSGGRGCQGPTHTEWVVLHLELGSDLQENVQLLSVPNAHFPPPRNIKICFIIKKMSTAKKEILVLAKGQPCRLSLLIYTHQLSFLVFWLFLPELTELWGQVSATLPDTSGISGGFATQGQREKEASDGGYLERNLKTEGCPPNENMQNLQCTHLSIYFFREKKKKKMSQFIIPRQAGPRKDFRGVSLPGACPCILGHGAMRS